MSRRRSSRAVAIQADHVMTWLFAGQVAFATVLGFLGFWLR